MYRPIDKVCQKRDRCFGGSGFGLVQNGLVEYLDLLGEVCGHDLGDCVLENKKKDKKKQKQMEEKKGRKKQMKKRERKNLIETFEGLKCNPMSVGEPDSGFFKTGIKPLIGNRVFINFVGLKKRIKLKRTKGIERKIP